MIPADRQDTYSFLKIDADYLRYFLFALLTGVLVYHPLMANHLVNHIDGIWHPSKFFAGNWELSLGRGLIQYADMARFGLVSSPWNSILAFVLFGIADCFIIKKFRLENTFFSYLFIFVSLANPVTSESLSYSYTSDNYALAYLFSVLAFYFTPNACGKTGTKSLVIGIIVSTLCLAISMSLYQAYICVYAVLSIFTIILMLKKNAEAKGIFGSSGLYFLTLTAGGLLYYIVTKLLLLRAGIEMASYKGADNAGILNMFKHLPQSVVATYREAFEYVVNGRLNANLDLSGVMVALVGSVLILTSIVAIVEMFKEKKSRILPTVALLAILPMAASCICILAPRNGLSGLMAMGILIGILMFYLLANENKYMRIAVNVAYIVMAWYLVSAVENDQIALREGAIATCNMTQNALSKMYAEGLLSKAQCVAFVGRTAENPLFYKSDAYEMANEYAQFGRWSTYPRNNMDTWLGITETMCGVSIPICGVKAYSEIVYTDEVSQMPVYPTEGYMKIINEVLVVKMSELY
ncbi:MAG: glucosyltransferase domain-containing protein [bacterium]|nr:glucosyltransferase domain-containing protein [bacterium]